MIVLYVGKDRMNRKITVLITTLILFVSGCEKSTPIATATFQLTLEDSFRTRAIALHPDGLERRNKIMKDVCERLRGHPSFMDSYVIGYTDSMHSFIINVSAIGSENEKEKISFELRSFSGEIIKTFNQSPYRYHSQSIGLRVIDAPSNPNKSELSIPFAPASLTP